MYSTTVHRSFLASVVLLASAGGLAAQRPLPVRTAAFAGLTCRATAEGFASPILRRAAGAIGLISRDSVLHVRGTRAVPQLIQSERTYPPFFDVFLTEETWFDPAGGVIRAIQTGGAFPSAPLPPSRFPVLTGPHAQWVLRDTVPVPARDFGGGALTRALHPWAVVYDFMHSADARVTGRCAFRDYDRVAIEREGAWGPERLLLDPKTWVPVGLIREEPQFLWGQVNVAYVWSNWSGVDGGGLYPLTVFKVVNGTSESRQTVVEAALLPADSAPPLLAPDTALRLTASADFFPADPVDTIRVGPAAWLLRNRFYTTGAVLARDTVFLLDATLNEARARQDSAWVARLFPGRHPIVLVVTDLAWPHIGGVRFWVAQGATIVAHRAARDFLAEVVNRRWTRNPDLLEHRRTRAPFRFRAVSDSMVLGGGAIALHAIDGVSSEVALMAWIPGERFLWPGDYIQNTGAPSQYAREVLRATRRVRIMPERFAAEHVRLTPWRVIDSLHADEPPAVLAAGDVDGTLLRTGRITSHATLTRGPETTDRGESVQNLSVRTVRGRPTLVAVREFQTPSGPAVDSSLADLATMLPIRHRGTHASRTMVLEFNGAHVAGRYAPADAPALPIDQSLQARPYDSSLYDWVIAALPLADGFAAQVPVYVYEQGGTVWYVVRVTGRDTVTLNDGRRVDTWAVSVHEDGLLRSRLWVTRDGPRDIARMSQYFSGAEYTQTH